MTEITPENSQNTAIAVAYLCTGIFLVIFFVVLMYGPNYNVKLGDPFVAGIIAFICVMPPFLPSLVAFLKSHLAGVAIAGFTFQFDKAGEDFRAETYAGDEEVRQMAGMQEHYKDVANAAGAMTTGSSTLINMVDEIIIKKHEQCFVNLFTGHTWLPANLYFFVYHLSRETLVRQVFFIETGPTGEEFVGMAAPREILAGLEKAFPEYRNAVDQMNKKSASFRDSGSHYFLYLREEYQKTQQAPVLWLDSKTLLGCIGNFLHRDQFGPGECLSEEDIRTILRNKYPYIAAVKNGRFVAAVNRDEFALKFARKTLCVKK